MQAVKVRRAGISVQPKLKHSRKQRTGESSSVPFEFGQKIQMPFSCTFLQEGGGVFHKSVSKKNKEVTYIISLEKKK